MDLTYQQVLADHYDENAKDLLVYPNITTEDVPPVDKHPDELEDQEDFQKFGGDRAPVEINPTPLPLFDDKTSLSVKFYSKDTIRYIYTIDSRFRQNLAVPKPVPVLQGSLGSAYLYTGTDAIPTIKLPISATTPTSPGSTTSNFTYTFPKPIKNVTSVKLLSVEIPNTVFQFAYNSGYTPTQEQFNGFADTSTGVFNYPYNYTGNTAFIVYFGNDPNTGYLHIIPDGNYDAPTLCTTIQNLLNNPTQPFTGLIPTTLTTNFGGIGRSNATMFRRPLVSSTNVQTTVYGWGSTSGKTFTVALNQITGKITITTDTVVVDPTTGVISSTTAYGNPFTIQFIDAYPDRQANFGLGYNLGFIDNRTMDPATSGIYSGFTSYTGEKVCEVIGDNYYLLQVADWNPLSVTSLNGHIINALSVIQISSVQFGVILGNQNLVTEQYWFRQPTNVSTISIKLLNAYGDVMNLQNMNMSITVEILEVLNPSMYEYIR
jgi:hypothetical protein